MKRTLVGLILTLFIGVPALAQGPAILKPPKGSQLAIVVFEDLQCPMCKQTSPVIENAARTYKIPLLRYDFPLPIHNWSFEAAVMARYFEKQSKELGASFRDYIFQHQTEIYPANLRGFANRFAAEHNTSLPFVVDPQGTLAAAVNADRDLGNRVGIQHTPTVYLVSTKPNRPFLEVQKPKDELFQAIDAMKRN
ncbi:MAG TPA: thioredoxin domain-containing protein [Terriglobales bacterium]|jgi:protein-disulfide isomerase